MPRMNRVLLTGTIHDVRNVALRSGVAQWATLWYSDDGHHVGVWCPSSVKYALNECEVVDLAGRLCGEHVLVEEVHAHEAG